MVHHIVVVGNAGAGKSALVAASLAHARRTKVSGVVERVVVDHAASGLHTRARLWAAHERTTVTTAAEIDQMAERLWRSWVASDPTSDSTRRSEILGAASLSAPWQLSVDANIVSDAPMVVIEARPEHVIGGPSGPTSFAAKRLRTEMTWCSRLVICVAAGQPWGRETQRWVTSVASLLSQVNMRAADVVIALTKIDMTLADRLYRKRQPLTAPIDEVLLHMGTTLLEEVPGLAGTLDELDGMIDVRLRPCSSYGWLPHSGTPNFDVVASDPTGHAEGGVRSRPLWPERLADVDRIRPSVPGQLREWEPLGVSGVILP